MTWWFCAEEKNAENYAWIKADRWFDARRTAWQLLGSERLWIPTLRTESPEPPLKAYRDRCVYEAKWEGSAAGLNDLRLEVNRILARKCVCPGCHTFFWPWELEYLSDQLAHILITPGESDGPSVRTICGKTDYQKKAA